MSLSQKERENITILADTLDVQIEEILSHGLPPYHEIRMAFNKIEEASMWLRRAIERWK